MSGPLIPELRSPAGGFAGPRGWAGAMLTLLLALAVFAAFLAVVGSATVAGVFALALFAALALASTAKRRVLGEALLFSDLALAGALLRHPQFYFSALHRWQLAVLAAGAVLLMVTLVALFVAAPGPHLAGLALLAGALALIRLLLALPPWRQMARQPDALADIDRHGLFAVLLLYWWRWLQTPDPRPPDPLPSSPADNRLLVIVQCESFADPAELFGEPALALPGLTAARAAAVHHGRLMVSGFGAYTMRTEYGVLFGRSEAELGFRRFDPYLTAMREAGHALPSRLPGWRSIFIHPHDLRFYGRHRILPAAGFHRLMGEADFPRDAPREGRYVADAAITEQIIAQARAASGPTLIMAVTIANHGPWQPDPPADAGTGQPRASSGYLRLVRQGDRMLSDLMAALASLGRPATLLFYGDHRPSIPQLSLPGGDRHTPYVLLQFDGTGPARQGGATAADLTPAQLHHLLLGLVR